MEGNLARNLQKALAAVAVCTAVMVGALPPASAGSKAPTKNHVPTQVVERVDALRRAFGSLSISPTSGPLGTTITIAGSCGFKASTVFLALAGETEPGFFIAVHAPYGITPITPSSLGDFSLELVLPEDGVGTHGPISSGVTYYVAVVCDLGLPTRRDLVPQPFTVT